MNKIAADPASDTRSLVIERELPHSPDKVWRALTQGALIEEWLMKNDFQPVVGHKFHFRGTPNPHWNGVTACEVLAVEPQKRLSYSWSDTEEKGGFRTVVTWTLTPTKNGVHLRFEQSGFPAGPQGEGFYQGATYGWQRFIGGLEKVTAGLS